MIFAMVLRCVLTDLFAVVQDGTEYMCRCEGRMTTEVHFNFGRKPSEMYIIFMNDKVGSFCDGIFSGDLEQQAIWQPFLLV